MSQPGWHPDPGGAPGQFRYWNGERWSHETSANPQGVPAEFAEGTGGRPTKLIGAFAALLVAALLGWVVWSQVLKDDTPAAEETTQTQPSTETTGGGSESPTSEGSGDPSATTEGSGEPTSQVTEASTELCQAGNQNDVPKGEGGVVDNSGLKLQAPAEWGFRLDKRQWTWLDDIWSYGDIKTGQRAITVGRLPEKLPEGEVGLKQQWLCWTTYGHLKDSGLPAELPGTIKAVERNGLKGHEVTAEVTDSDGVKGTIRIAIFATQGARVAVLGYYDSKAAPTAKKQIDDAFASISPS